MPRYADFHQTRAGVLATDGPVSRQGYPKTGRWMACSVVVEVKQ